MTPSSKNRTFTEEARRKQIIEAAIETIAVQGFQKSSLSEIAKHVGISQSVISYHFDGKNELIAETINTILARTNAFIKAKVDAQTTATGKLTAYIEASFEYELANRDLFIAMVELWGSFSEPDKEREFFGTSYKSCRRHLAKIIEEGQASGEFREVPPVQMGAIIQATIDGLMLQWVFDSEAVDFEVCCQNLVEMLIRHTGT